MIQDENELPCVLDDFPNYHLKSNAEVIEKPASLSDEQFRRDIAFKYLQSLERVFRTKCQNTQQVNLAVSQALTLYDNQFNKVLANSIFRDTEFPLADYLEQVFDEEFDQTAKLFYNETCFRHSFSKLFAQQFNVDVAVSSWNNYEMLFETLVQNEHNYDLPIPTTWIWDILDEFSYQFYMCSRWRKSMKGDDQSFIENFNKKQVNFWNLEEVVKRLSSFVTTSGILKPDFNVEINKLRTIHYFGNKQIYYYIKGFYALLVLVKVFVMLGDFNSAIEQFSRLSYKYLIVYSRSGGAYLALFTFSGFSYLMTNRFKESAILFQSIVLFYNKYKQLYSKSFQFDQMNKSYEKVVCLLAISLVFYPQPLDDTIKTIFKEIKIKQKERKDQTQQSQGELVYEKFEKINKFDSQAFQELFFFASPKIVQGLVNVTDLKNVGSEVSVNDLLNEKKEKLLEEFSRIQKLNNISSILKLYSNLTLEKTARLLQISEEELTKLLDLYKQRSLGPLNRTIFEETIIKQFETDKSMLDFTINNGVITVMQTNEIQRDLSSQISRLNQKMEKTIGELTKLYDV